MAASRITLGSGVHADSGLMMFDFRPSVGIVAKELYDYAGEFSSFAAPLRKCVQEVMSPSIIKNFDAEGRPNAWEPLSPDTVARKQARGADLRILHATRGARSLWYTASRLARWKITPNYAVFNNMPPSKWYGALHQSGASASATKTSGTLEERIARGIAEGPGARFGSWELPARPFVMFQQEDLPKIEEVFDDWLRLELMKVGGWRVSPV